MTKMPYPKDEVKPVALWNTVMCANGNVGSRLPIVKVARTGFEKRPLRFWTYTRFDGCVQLWNDRLHPNPNHRRSFARGMLWRKPR